MKRLVDFGEPLDRLPDSVFVNLEVAGGEIGDRSISLPLGNRDVEVDPVHIDPHAIAVGSCARPWLGLRWRRHGRVRRAFRHCRLGGSFGALGGKASRAGEAARIAENFSRGRPLAQLIQVADSRSFAAILERNSGRFSFDCSPGPGAAAGVPSMRILTLPLELNAWRRVCPSPTSLPNAPP